MRRPHPVLVALSIAPSILALPAAAIAQTQVLVIVTGSVDFEDVSGPPFGAVQAGQHATMSFELDVNAFTDGPSGRTRGYPIELASFSLTLGTSTVGLRSPSAETAYFVVRDDDGGVDGFMLSTDLSLASGVPLDEDGSSGPFRDDFSVTYDVSTLLSVDIVDAAGDYAAIDAIDSHWAIEDGASTPIGLHFTAMAIEVLILDPLLRRGDCNGDSLDDIADAISLLTSLFPNSSGPPYVPCKDSCDGNDDGQLDIADAIAILGSLFGSPTLPLPPPTGACGLDPTPDNVPCFGQPAC